MQTFIESSEIHFCNVCECCHVDCDLAKVRFLISLASRWYPEHQVGYATL